MTPLLENGLVRSRRQMLWAEFEKWVKDRSYSYAMEVLNLIDRLGEIEDDQPRRDAECDHPFASLVFQAKGILCCLCTKLIKPSCFHENHRNKLPCPDCGEKQSPEFSAEVEEKIGELNHIFLFRKQEWDQFVKVRDEQVRLAQKSRGEG